MPLLLLEGGLAGKGAMGSSGQETGRDPVLGIILACLVAKRRGFSPWKPTRSKGQGKGGYFYPCRLATHASYGLAKVWATAQNEPWA